MSRDPEVQMTPAERRAEAIDVLAEGLWQLIVSGRAREIETRDRDEPDTEQSATAAQPSDPDVAPQGPRIITGYIHRTRSGTKITDWPPATEVPKPTRRPARVAQTLALAHRFQQALDNGKYRDQAELARQFGFTRARVTQILNLTYLAPDIQEAILFLEAVDGREPISERDLRQVARTLSWPEQRELWARIARPTTVADVR